MNNHISNPESIPQIASCRYEALRSHKFRAFGGFGFGRPNPRVWDQCGVYRLNPKQRKPEAQGSRAFGFRVAEPKSSTNQP